MEALIDSKQDFFSNLPTEIMIDILSRLAIPTVMRCKRVCKSWLNSVSSLEFAKSHVSKSGSVSGLARDEGCPLTVALCRGENISKPYEILELVDSEDSGLHCNVVFKFNFPHRQLILLSSANGLLLMLNKVTRNRFIICNPITREYIKLPPPPPRVEDCMHKTFGFGVSKLTGKYKVVRMFHHLSDSWVRSPTICEVYTLGTGSWRSVAHGRTLLYSTRLGVFFNGNVHWLMPGRILYFDLETECFSTFSFPHHGGGISGGVRTLCAFGDSLCLCYNADDVVDIWLMNKYGDDESWRKEFVIKKNSAGPVVPIKMFRNGDIMFANQHKPKLYCYSNSSETETMLDLGCKPRASMSRAFFHSKPLQRRM